MHDQVVLALNLDSINIVVKRRRQVTWAAFLLMYGIHIFDPWLSDGTTNFEGESYNRVDNSHLTFTVIMGRASLEIIEVEATINSSNVLRFKLDGKTYRFIKANS